MSSKMDHKYNDNFDISSILPIILNVDVEI